MSIALDDLRSNIPMVRPPTYQPDDSDFLLVQLPPLPTGLSTIYTSQELFHDQHPSICFQP